MFPIGQNSASLDPLGGFGQPPTLLPLAGGSPLSLQRLGPAMLAPTGLDPSMAPMLLMQQQMNQMLLSMMQLLMLLMLNRQGGNSGNSALSGASGLSGVDGGASGGGSTGGVSGSGPVVNSSQTPPAGGPKVQKLIDAALSKQGTPYVFGAAGPDKFDCSGLVSWALKQAGSNVPRLTAEGLRRHYSNAAVSRDQLKPGDLVFFWSPNDRGIPRGQATHVEIYLGDGKTMGTDSPKEGAKVEPINWDTFIGGARPPELAA